MINFEKFELDNGLQVYVHPDINSTVAAFNICYNVGSRDEQESKTGFAHLFEHLMFGGSKNIAYYDEPLQKVGGENNAFTSPDITNYYITLPTENLETAFWLESDRMLSLSFDPKVLEVQRNVVIEEFKQRYLNQPYGDVWLKLRPLAYERHPYKWAPIGKDISHIENATMNDVKEFFYKYYVPNNAVLVVGGNVSTEQIKRLAEKWFGDIPSGVVNPKNLPQEIQSIAPKFLETSAKVPLSAIYKTFLMPGKHHPQYVATDLLSDLMGRSKSSRLHQKLVKESKIFNSINAYVTGSLDPGLMVISGNINNGIKIEEANATLEDVISGFVQGDFNETEIEKVKNQSFSTIAFGEVELLNRVMSIAFAANAGDANYCNTDVNDISLVSKKDIQTQAKEILKKENSSTMYYRSEMN